MAQPQQLNQLQALLLQFKVQVLCAALNAEGPGDDLEALAARISGVVDKLAEPSPIDVPAPGVPFMMPGGGSRQ